MKFPELLTETGTEPKKKTGKIVIHDETKIETEPQKHLFLKLQIRNFQLIKR